MEEELYSILEYLISIEVNHTDNNNQRELLEDFHSTIIQKQQSFKISPSSPSEENLDLDRAILDATNNNNMFQGFVSTILLRSMNHHLHNR
jgi:hypothetical protein